MKWVVHVLQPISESVRGSTSRAVYLKRLKAWKNVLPLTSLPWDESKKVAPIVRSSYHRSNSPCSFSKVAVALDKSTPSYIKPRSNQTVDVPKPQSTKLISRRNDTIKLLCLVKNIIQFADLTVEIKLSIPIKINCKPEICIDSSPAHSTYPSSFHRLTIPPPFIPKKIITCRSFQQSQMPSYFPSFIS